MIVLVDNSEQVPWTFDGQPITTQRVSLETGDYSLPGFETRVAIERKSLDDWVGTVMRERGRFYRELERMQSFDFACVIIEGSIREIMRGSYKSRAEPKAVLGFIAEVGVAQKVRVYLGGSRPEAQLLAGALLRMCAEKLPLRVS